MRNRAKIARKQALMRERGMGRYSPRQHTFKMVKGERVCSDCRLVYGRQMWKPCLGWENRSQVKSTRLEAIL